MSFIASPKIFSPFRLIYGIRINVFQIRSPNKWSSSTLISCIQSLLLILYILHNETFWSTFPTLWIGSFNFAPLLHTYFNFSFSHFLLTLVCSSNFFIYYFKHGSLCKSRRKAAANRAKIQTELGSPAMHQQTGTTTLMNMTIETSNSASTRPELLRLSTR